MSEDIELILEPLEDEKKDDVVVVEQKEPEISVEDGIAELKAKLEEEKKARLEAENRYKQASEQANVAKNDANDSNLKLIDNAIETVKRNQEILKQNLRDAMSIGDYDAAADIQNNMMKSELDLRQLHTGKKQYEDSLRAQPKVNANPVEEFASRLTPRSAEWVRKNPDYVRDPRLQKKMVAAHELAIADGIEPDTDEYFAAVEGALKMQRITNTDQESALSTASQSTTRRSSPPAAPVSRSGTGTGGRPNVVSLTAAEREMARSWGWTDKEYALNKLKG